MSERRPGMSRENPRNSEKREREKVEPKRDSSWKRKLALAGLLVAGVATQFERRHEEQVADHEKHQKLTPEDQRHLDEERKKLLMAAKILSEIRPVETHEMAVAADTEEDEVAMQEQWFNLNSALQNARVDLESIRTFRPRNGDYGSFQERVSQHPEAEEIFDNMMRSVQVEYTDDGIYAKLDGDNGFDLAITVDTDPITHEAILGYAISDGDGDTAEGHPFEGDLSQEELDNITQRKVAAYIENSVAAATKREIASRYPDYKEPPFIAPGAEEETAW